MVLETLARIVKVQLPAYLRRLPLPESVGGFIRLTGRWGGGGGLDPRVAPLHRPSGGPGRCEGSGGAGPGRAERRASAWTPARPPGLPRVGLRLPLLAPGIARLLSAGLNKLSVMEEGNPTVKSPLKCFSREIVRPDV